MKINQKVFITRPGWEGKGVIKGIWNKQHFIVASQVAYGFKIVLHKKFLRPRTKAT